MTAPTPLLPEGTRFQRPAGTGDSEDRVRIGALAKLSGVTVETIRYYEKRGLIARSTRLASGYREFPVDAIRQVRFVGRAQSLGFTLTEVEELVILRRQAWVGDAPMKLRDAAAGKLKDIDARVRELRELRRELAELISECDDACAQSCATAPVSGPECPIVEAFDSTTRSSGARRRKNDSTHVRGTHAQAEPSTRREPLRARGTKTPVRRKQ
jgi:DNA-binding transcriptional MerR regulator